jgi:hypothetical protein
MAMGVFQLTPKVADQRDVVIGANHLAAVGAAGSWQDGRLQPRESMDHDVEVASDEQS